MPEIEVSFSATGHADKYSAGRGRSSAGQRITQQWLERWLCLAKAGEHFNGEEPVSVIWGLSRQIKLRGSPHSYGFRLTKMSSGRLVASVQTGDNDSRREISVIYPSDRLMDDKGFLLSLRSACEELQGQLLAERSGSKMNGEVRPFTSQEKRAIEAVVTAFRNKSIAAASAPWDGMVRDSKMKFVEVKEIVTSTGVSNAYNFVHRLIVRGILVKANPGKLNTTDLRLGMLAEQYFTAVSDPQYQQLETLPPVLTATAPAVVAAEPEVEIETEICTVEQLRGTSEQDIRDGLAASDRLLTAAGIYDTLVVLFGKPGSGGVEGTTVVNGRIDAIIAHLGHRGLVEKTDARESARGGKQGRPAILYQLTDAREVAKVVPATEAAGEPKPLTRPTFRHPEQNRAAILKELVSQSAGNPEWTINTLGMKQLILGLFPEMPDYRRRSAVAVLVKRGFLISADTGASKQQTVDGRQITQRTWRLAQSAPTGAVEAAPAVLAVLKGTDSLPSSRAVISTADKLAAARRLVLEAVSAGDEIARLKQEIKDRQERIVALDALSASERIRKAQALVKAFEEFNLD